MWFSIFEFVPWTFACSPQAGIFEIVSSLENLSKIPANGRSLPTEKIMNNPNADFVEFRIPCRWAT